MELRVGQLIQYEEYKIGHREKFELTQRFLGRIVEIFKPNEVITVDKFKLYSKVYDEDYVPDNIKAIAYSPLERIVIQTKEKRTFEDAIYTSNEAEQDMYELITIVPPYMKMGTQKITVIDEQPNQYSYIAQMREF